MLTRRRVALGTALAVLLGALAWVGYAVWLRPTEFARASSLLPASTLRVTWTDWAGLRDELGSLSTQELIDRDLTTSSLLSSAAEIKQGLGFSPLDAQWELMGQGRDGLALVLKFDDVEKVADGLEEAGYSRPDSDDLDGASWRGSTDLLNGMGLTTFELTNVAFLADEGLMIASDRAPYLADAVKTAKGDEDGLDLDGLAPDGDPLALTAFVDDYACEALSMTQADDDAQTVAASLISEAGGVSPLKGYLVAMEPDGVMSIVLAFEDEDQAERNLDPRRALAGAEDPGQGIAYPDSFRLTDAVASGHHVVITAKATKDGYPLTNLTTGPVLLASC